jgi:WD40 repeat protein
MPRVMGWAWMVILMGSLRYRHHGNRISTLVGHRSWVLSVDIRVDGDMLASGSADRTVKIWDIAGTRECVDTVTEGEGEVWGVAWSKTGKQLACGSEDGSLRWYSEVTRG